MERPAATEYRILRETIASRGGLRSTLALSGLGLWALLLVAVLAWIPYPLGAIIPLLALVATFEVVRPLHFGTERIGRYLQAFYEEDGQLVGQQYPSDTGPIDILAISKDKKELLVVELKRGRVSDVVVGQIQRYMGYVQEELAESNQIVKGVIIGSDNDLRIKRALVVTRNIEFFKYQISFKLIK